MGVAELFRVISTDLKKWHSAPGTQVVVKGEGLGGQTAEAEKAFPPGLYSRPPKGFVEIFIPIGTGRRYGLFIGGINYAANINISPGETCLYSSDANGTVKARLDLDATGKVAVTNDAGKSLKIVLKTLIEHVRDLTTINCVVGAPVTLSPAAMANLNADITALEAILK